METVSPADSAAEDQDNEERVLTADGKLARDIARFIADRAQLFSGVEARAWALTDFGVWAVLADRTALLTLGPPPSPDETEEVPS